MRLMSRAWGEDPSEYLASRFESMFFENADAVLKARIVETAVRTPHAAIEAIARATGLWDALGLDVALGTVPPTVPVLAIQSTFHDHKTKRLSLSPETTTTPWLDHLRQYLPQLEVTIVPGVGHFNMVEAPDQISAAIRHFAEKLRNGRTASPEISPSPQVK